MTADRGEFVDFTLRIAIDGDLLSPREIIAPAPGLISSTESTSPATTRSRILHRHIQIFFGKRRQGFQRDARRIVNRLPGDSCGP